MGSEAVKATLVIWFRDQILNRLVPGVVRTTPWSWVYWNREATRRWESPKLLGLLWERARGRDTQA